MQALPRFSTTEIMRLAHAMDYLRHEVLFFHRIDSVNCTLIAEQVI